MLIINIKGGLGNQMFQYAFAHLRAKKLNKNVFILDSTKFATVPREYRLNIFGINPSITNKIFLFLANILVALLALFHGRLKLLDRFYLQDLDNQKLENARADKVTLLNGYWQRANYYIDNSIEIKKLFSFPAIPEKHNILKFDLEKKYIAMHIRRGDYVSKSGNDSIHLVCDIDWYQNSLRQLTAIEGDAKIIIFTDDDEWVKDNFPFSHNDIFVVPNDPEREAWIDLYFMSLCNHFIISNSSFSWWAAFIGQKSDSIVIAPKYWFKDIKTESLSICPENWELI